jgi:DNA polymerase I-like protein with 3'-5' exonuclease and polymerase domains
MGVGFEYVTSDLRQVGKRGRHAFNYDVGKHELMLTVNTDLAKMKSDLRISEWRAGQILQAIDEISPNIRKVYHAEVRRILEETRTLITPFGRRRMFFDRWGNELFKEAYSYIPQSTVADHMKASMLRIWRRVPEVRFLVESHDGFLCEIPLDLLHTLCQVIKEELETSIDFSKCSISRPSLRIPCEIQVGFNWKDMEKYVVGKTYNRVN